MSGTRIVGMGHHQPVRVLTNDELAQMVDTSDEWIRQRTGIVRRHLADDETVSDLATASAGKALAAAGLQPTDVDMVVVATFTAAERCPSVAAEVAGRLAIPAPVTFDLNNACAGFCTALATADHAIRAGAARHALVIGAEKMSDVTDWTDRTSCVLLGDGAGAAVVSATGDGEADAIGPVVWGSDPSKRQAVRLDGGWHPTFAQEGQTVFRWATTELTGVAQEACRRVGLTPADLAAVVTHQANLRIIDALVRRLDLPEHVQVAQDVVESGNTSAASVPLALSKLVASGTLTPGSPVLLIGFGGGLSWAAQVIRCP